MDIKIITARQAKEITEKHIPCDLEDTLKYVMGHIQGSAKNGSNFIEFKENFVPCIYYNTIKSDNFKKYIEKLGYHYSFTSEEKWGCYFEWIIISW